MYYHSSESGIKSNITGFKTRLRCPGASRIASLHLSFLLGKMGRMIPTVEFCFVLFFKDYTE